MSLPPRMPCSHSRTTWSSWRSVPRCSSRLCKRSVSRSLIPSTSQAATTTTNSRSIKRRLRFTLSDTTASAHHCLRYGSKTSQHDESHAIRARLSSPPQNAPSPPYRASVPLRLIREGQTPRMERYRRLHHLSEIYANRSIGIPLDQTARYRRGTRH